MSNKEELQVKNLDKLQTNKDFMSGIFRDTIWFELSDCCYSNMEFKQRLETIFETMKDIEPRDHVEMMLVAQMLATHHAAMKCFKRSASCLTASGISTLEIGNTILNSATKLVRSYTMQMEALNRYRGKGQQKMTVEHVHINSGGKAIIGNINSTKEVKIEEGKGEVENKK
jgi:hypothetical protein